MMIKNNLFLSLTVWRRCRWCRIWSTTWKGPTEHQTLDPGEEASLPKMFNMFPIDQSVFTIPLPC